MATKILNVKLKPKSTKTKVDPRFSISSSLNSLPDETGHQANLLDFYVTFFFDKCYTEMLSHPLDISDNSHNEKVNAKLKTSAGMPFNRTIFRYAKTEWNSFRSPKAEILLSAFFKYTASRTSV